MADVHVAGPTEAELDRVALAAQEVVEDAVAVYGAPVDGEGRLWAPLAASARLLPSEDFPSTSFRRSREAAVVVALQRPVQRLGPLGGAG